jgi:hypothetical protein
MRKSQPGLGARRAVEVNKDGSQVVHDDHLASTRRPAYSVAAKGKANARVFMGHVLGDCTWPYS